ncbi:MAG: ABC transporter permease [Labilithrix sp.]|nr:ABC transporter permease [Labilithrix sp.]
MTVAWREQKGSSRSPDGTPRLPPVGLASDLRAIKVVWHRELLRFVKDRPRLIAGLAQPVLYLFVMGTGLSAMVPSTSGVPFRTFLFPGVLCMAILFSCFFAAGSLVWDRELGFMREMMVAPVRRGAILLGKCLGGTTVGTIQGMILMVIGAVGGVPMSLELVVTIFFELLVICFAITAFGVALATRVRSIQAFMALMQMVLLPMFFASGALYPLTGLPAWLEALTRLDPLSYAVAPLRHAVLGASGKAALAPMVTWGSFVVPIWLDLVIVALYALVALGVAHRRFARDDA